MELTEQQKLEILCAYLPHGVSMVGCQSKLNPYMVDGFINGNFDAEPILRHPDDMTESEILELAYKLGYIDSKPSLKLVHDFAKGGEDGVSVTSKEIQSALRYLHSIHVDTFGAIEAGWAIRKENN